MCRVLEEMGLTPEVHHHEVATAGQCEIGVAFNSLTAKADEVQTLKYVVMNVAQAYGKTATFMPKPVVGDNGNGMHVHQSIAKDGKNLFSGEAYGGLSEKVRELGSTYRDYRSGLARLIKLKDSTSDRVSRLELLRYQANELEELRLREGELEELEDTQTRLSNIGELQASCATILGQLDQNENNLSDILNRCINQLDNILNLDLYWWRYSMSRSRKDAVNLKNALMDLESKETKSVEANIYRLIQLSYRFRYEVKRYNVIGAIILRSDIREQINKVETEGIPFSDYRVKLFELYLDLFEFSENTLKPFMINSNVLRWISSHLRPDIILDLGLIVSVLSRYSFFLSVIALMLCTTPPILLGSGIFT